MILMAMFFVWVLAPYVALWVITSRVRAWTPSARRTMRYAACVISLAALARYVWVQVWPLKAQPASTFMIVPFVSWIAIGVVWMIARRSSRAS